MPPGSEAAIRLFAMRQLAGREMSSAQLRRQLDRRFPDADATLIEATMADLAQSRFVDDRRFAQHVVARNRERGRPWLEAKLRNAGVDDGLADAVLGEVAWPTLAQAVNECIGRLGLTPPLGAREAARLSRCLARLGYDADEIEQEVERLT